LPKRQATIAEQDALDREVRGVSFSLDEVGDGEDLHLELRALHRHNFGAICADWTGTELKRRIGAGKRQPIARAVGLHKPVLPGDAPLKVLDATAGLGRDGFTLAALGAAVTLAERNHTVCALLHDAHRRALALAATRDAASRIEIIEADARAVLAGGTADHRWDVVYLDPMYPDDGKAALPSKEMQILRDLTDGDDDADSLLAPALACARVRVVVKRPPKAPWLAREEPSMSIGSTQLRFDVYLKAAIRVVPPTHDFHIP
jgi:16S rRNA (guanine1516-N2)-methyltransferase